VRPARARQTGRALALCALLALLPGCARLLYNFGEVRPGQIYRSAQPSPLFLRWLVREHGIRTLINLRGRTPGYESHFAAVHGLRVFSFDLSAIEPPSEADVQRFLAIVSDPANQPVLVHCRQGVDRTGYMLALYRMQHEGWTAERAAREMNWFWQFEPLNAMPQAVVHEDLRSEAPAND
jgi:tyrosine-protein phosphatase SIW14